MGTLRATILKDVTTLTSIEMTTIVGGAAKVWSQADTAGVSDVDLNLTSVDDSGTGYITFNYTNNFGSVTYARVGNMSETDGSPRSNRARDALSSSSCALMSESGTGTDLDPAGGWFYAAYGDLA